MIPPTARNKNIMQLCWVVPDLDAAIDYWVRQFGAGPFFVFDALHFDEPNYRGEAFNIQQCRATIGQSADMQIELIEPTDNGPGLWTEVVPKGQLGFHHVGLYCEDYAAEQQAIFDSGAELAFEGLMMGAKTCYIDTTKTLGFMTELITANPIAAEVFGAIKAASEGWDGSDPVRTMG